MYHNLHQYAIKRRAFHLHFVPPDNVPIDLHIPETSTIYWLKTSEPLLVSKGNKIVSYQRQTRPPLLTY